MKNTHISKFAENGKLLINTYYQSKILLWNFNSVLGKYRTTESIVKAYREIDA